MLLSLLYFMLSAVGITIPLVLLNALYHKLLGTGEELSETVSFYLDRYKLPLEQYKEEARRFKEM